MEENKNIEDNLKNASPNLFSAGKENPFFVPDNYFEKLQNAITEQCVIHEKKKNPPVIYVTFRKIIIPLAVAVSLIFIILILNRKDNDKSVTTEQYALNTYNGASEYLDYLIENDELDESLIISEIVNDDTSKTGSSHNKAEENIRKLNENPVILSDTLTKMNITEDDIIQYLLEEDESDDFFN